jgi:hypothetical protein
VILSLPAPPLPSVTSTVIATSCGVSGQKNLVWLAVGSANVPPGVLQRKVSSSVSEFDVEALTCALPGGWCLTRRHNWTHHWCLTFGSSQFLVRSTALLVDTVVGDGRSPVAVSGGSRGKVGIIEPGSKDASDSDGNWSNSSFDDIPTMFAVFGLSVKEGRSFEGDIVVSVHGNDISKDRAISERADEAPTVFTPTGVRWIYLSLPVREDHACRLGRRPSSVEKKGKQSCERSRADIINVVHKSGFGKSD